MKISRIDVFKVLIPLTECYELSGGRIVRDVDCTVLRVETDRGLVGWGETCPFGRLYLPAHAEGARAAIEVLAPELIGIDALGPEALYDRMNAILRGSGYAKAGLDMALWDLLGKALDVPCYKLLGGSRTTAPLPFNATIPYGPTDGMINVISSRREIGYRQYSLKASGRAESDAPHYRAIAASIHDDEFMIADANGGWTQPDAIRVASALAGFPVYIEQPCASLEECRAVRQRTSLPMILDEIIENPVDLHRAWAMDALDVFNMKIQRVGGLTIGRQMRDFSVNAGLKISIQEPSGSEIGRAATGHLARATPARNLMSIWDVAELNSFAVAEDKNTVSGGSYRVSDAPGLGVSPIPAVLGRPIMTFGTAH